MSSYSVWAQGPMQAPAPTPTVPTPSPAPVLDCTSALLNLSSCMTYVEEGSNLTRPEKGCCRGLAGLVDNRPVCLCRLLASSDAFGVRIDTIRALMLPTACRVDTRPATLCSAIGIPVASPVPSSPATTGGGVPEIAGSPIESSPSVEPGVPADSPPPGGGSRSSRLEVDGLLFLLLSAGAVIGSMITG